MDYLANKIIHMKLWRPAAKNAISKFPTDENKQQEFIDKILQKTLTPGQFEDFKRYLEELQVIISLENIESQCKKIKATPSDSRYDIANKILVEMDQLLERIEQKKDYSIIVLRILSLCQEANFTHINPMAEMGSKFIAGRTKKRLDALGHLMLESLKTFYYSNGRMPSAKELWNAVPTGKIIQEKVYYDEIAWLSPKGGRKTPHLGHFQID